MSEYDYIKSNFARDVRHFQSSGYRQEPPSAGMRGACINVLERACGGETNRRLVLKELTGHTSSRDLTPAQWYALLQLVMPCPSETAKCWIGQEMLERFCATVLAHINEADGKQGTLFGKD